MGLSDIKSLFCFLNFQVLHKVVFLNLNYIYFNLYYVFFLRLAIRTKIIFFVFAFKKFF